MRRLDTVHMSANYFYEIGIFDILEIGPNKSYVIST